MGCGTTQRKAPDEKQHGMCFSEVVFEGLVCSLCGFWFLWVLSSAISCLTPFYFLRNSCFLSSIGNFTGTAQIFHTLVIHSVCQTSSFWGFIIETSCWVAFWVLFFGFCFLGFGVCFFFESDFSLQRFIHFFKWLSKWRFYQVSTCTQAHSILASKTCRSHSSLGYLGLKEPLQIESISK